MNLEVTRNMPRGSNPKSRANLKRFGRDKPPAINIRVGAAVKEHMNAMRDRTTAELLKISRDPTTGSAKACAANRILNSRERPTLSDFQPFIRGEKTLDELDASGVDTSVIKRIKVKTFTGEDGVERVEREIELFDRARLESEFVVHESDGTPTQTIRQETTLKAAIKFEFPSIPLLDDSPALLEG